MDSIDKKIAAILDPKFKSDIMLRRFKRQSLTKTLKSLEETPPRSQTDLSFYKNKLIELKNNLLSYDADIAYFLSDGAVLSGEEFCTFSEIAEDYMDRLNRAVDKISVDLEALLAVPNPSPVQKEEKVLPKITIPCIDFPIFESKPEDYETFIQGFETLLNKYDLSQFEKLSYLRKQIRGQAKDIIDSVPDSPTCYDIAKNLMERAFCKLTTQRFSVIEKISKMKLDNSTPSLKWIGEVRTLREQITRLEIDADVFFQYFLWSGMSDSYKQEFISVTQKTKPDLEEILENAFDVVERINELGGSVKHKKFEPKPESIPGFTPLSNS